jgi:hypothetical protein
MNQMFNTEGISEFNGFLDPEVMQLFSEEETGTEPAHK